MNSSSINSDFFGFIDKNINKDVAALRFKYHGKETAIDSSFAITQIECRKKYRKKLEDFIAHKTFLFPSILAGEQASHQAIARFHASLFHPDEKVLDMTAGLGIDSLTIAGKVESMLACELDEDKAECLKYNAKVLGLNNFTVINDDSSRVIKETDKRFDTIFIDPARRDSANARVYNFHDCQPDILHLLPEAFAISKRILIKASPMLDITQTLSDIPCTTVIRCISVEGECKEVLIEAKEKRPNERGHIEEAVNLDRDGNVLHSFRYNSTDNKLSLEYATDSDILESNYLYEPDASVMKLAPWSRLVSYFQGLKKLGHSSHLFVSDHLFKDFPGRILRINGIIEKKDRKTLKGLPANVVVRNYPISADELRKNLGVKEGKDVFIYGTRLGQIPLLLLTHRITGTSNSDA